MNFRSFQIGLEQKLAVFCKNEIVLQNQNTDLEAIHFIIGKLLSICMKSQTHVRN